MLKKVMNKAQYACSVERNGIALPCEIGVLPHEIVSSAEHHPHCVTRHDLLHLSRTFSRHCIRPIHHNVLLVLSSTSHGAFQLLSFHHDALHIFFRSITLLCQFSRPSITMLFCPFSRQSVTMFLVFGTRVGASGSRRRVLFTHQLVLDTSCHDHEDGHILACLVQQLNFQ